MIRIKTTKVRRANSICMTNVCEIEWDKNCEAIVSEEDAVLLDERFEDIMVVGKATKRIVKEDVENKEEDEVDKELQEKIKGLNTLPLKELQDLAKEIGRDEAEWNKKKKPKLIEYIVEYS